MGYVPDATNDRARLVGDGFGWSRYKKALAVQEAGDNALLVVRRMWLDTLAASVGLIEYNLAWQPALYWGLSHDGNHFDRPGAYNDAGVNFYGVVQNDGGLGDDDAVLQTIDTDVAKRDYALPVWYNSGYLAYATFHDGNGDGGSILNRNHYISSSGKTDAEMLLTVPANPTVGLTASYIDYIYQEEGNDGIRSESWINTDSIDLKSLVSSDLDIENPKALFPVSNGWTTGVKQLNGTAETGGQWMPTTGNPHLPTHFLARYPFSAQEMVIDTVISKTGQLYV